MRLLSTCVAIVSILVPAPSASQDWTLEADVAVHTAYEWRGLQFDPGLNAQYAAYGSLAWNSVMVTAGVWSLADLSSQESVGLPERWGFETSPWIEATVGGDRSRLIFGATAYSFRAPAPEPALRRGDTWELYVGGRSALPGAPLLGEALLYWDMDRVGGGYLELAGALQIPLWVGVVVPIGSIFLEGRSGFSLGQERTGGETDPSDFYFAERGLTHVDMSLRLTLLPIPLGGLSASLTVAPHFVRSFDPETLRRGATVGGPVDRNRWSWVFGLRVAVPRCRPDRELCRDL
jgi:hypothetical protein